MSMNVSPPPSAGTNTVLPPELQTGNIPQETYRGDGRPPETIFNYGFQPQDPSGPITRDSLETYARGHSQGPYVSTSRDESTAERFARNNNGWVYDVRPPANQSIDVNTALGSSSPYPHEEEIAIAGSVSGSEIERARNPSSGEVIYNPRFGNPNAPRYDPSSPIPPPSPPIPQPDPNQGMTNPFAGMGSGGNSSSSDSDSDEEFVNPFAPGGDAGRPIVDDGGSSGGELKK